ncbi:MAG: hypothetical protein ABIJ30_07665 [bacterium]
MAHYARKHQLQKSLIYHVINRGNARSNIFHDEEDFSHFRGLLRKYKETHGFLLYHFCFNEQSFSSGGGDGGTKETICGNGWNAKKLCLLPS